MLYVAYKYVAQTEKRNSMAERKKEWYLFFRGQVGISAKKFSAIQTSDSGSKASYKAKGEYKMPIEIQASAIRFNIRIVYNAAVGSSIFIL